MPIVSPSTCKIQKCMFHPVQKMAPLNLLISNQYLFKSLKTYNTETKRLNFNENA